MSSTKLLVTVLLFTAVITSPLYSQTAMAPWAGYGSAENPYQISTLENLYWIAEDEIRWGYSYVQTADIDAGETKSWFSGSGWAPIGNSPTSFTGNYDGRGHRIDSLFINRPTQENIGLFGRTDEAIIDRVGLTNCNITGNNYVGGLVGDALSGTLIISCYSTGSVSGNKFIGGLVGYAPSNTISSCYSTGAVSGNEFIGGLVGWASNRTISNSYSTGAVSGSSNVGGLVGWASSTISNSYSNGAVSGNDGVGGLVGDANDGCTISSSYSTGSVTGSSSVGGLIGYNSGSTVNKSFWDVDSSGQPTSAGGTGKTTPDMKTMSTYTDSTWDFMGETGNGTDDIWGINNRDNNGYPFLKWQGYKLEQTVSFTVPDTVPDTLMYGDDPFTINASSSANLSVIFTSSDPLVAEISGNTVVIKGAGSATITARQDGDGTYYPASSSKKLTVRKKPASITGVTAADKVYNGTTAATLSGGNLSGLVTGDIVTLTNGTGAFASKNVGTGKAVTVSGYAISGTDASNYTLTSQPSGLTADITKKSLTVTGVTAADKVYNGTTAATLSGGTLSGLVTGDLVTLTKGTGVFASKNAGTGKAITASGYSLSGTDASNYTISQPSGLTADITRKSLTVTGVTAADKVYNGTTAATLSGGTLSGLVTGDVVTLTKGTGVFASKKVGTGKAITASGYAISGTGASNYTISQPSGITADITPAPLTIKAADAEKGRYEEDPVFTVTYIGFVAGDNSSAVSGLVVEREPGEKPGTYSIIPSGASAANYEIEYVNGTFTINGSTSVLNNHITVNENKISRPVKGIFIGSNPVSLSSAKADFRIVAGYPSELRVTIYDASGNAVFEKNASAYTGTVDMSWNLYTNGGHRAGSGVYLIVAKVKSRVNGSSEVLMEKLGLR